LAPPHEFFDCLIQLGLGVAVTFFPLRVSGDGRHPGGICEDFVQMNDRSAEFRNAQGLFSKPYATTILIVIAPHQPGYDKSGQEHGHSYAFERRTIAFQSEVTRHCFGCGLLPVRL